MPSRTVASPVGPLTIHASARGVTAIDFADAGADDASPVLDQAAAELGEYFAGARETFAVPVDWGGRDGFRVRAQQAIARIPYGTLVTYRDIAAGAGDARATQAAGTACRTNPVPIIVPCHRVIRTDGTIGGFGGDMPGGLDIKSALLRLEGVAL